MKVKYTNKKSLWNSIDGILFPDVLPRASQSGTVAAWAGVIVAAGSAVYAGVQSSKTQKGNEALAGQAREDELKRRAAAAGEVEKLMSEYNKLREERPGLTVREWMGERVKALNDPAAKEAFRKAKTEDFIQAQALADAATRGNVSTFEYAMDKLSGGKAMEFLAKRNELAMTETTADAYKRAVELQSSVIPAGSVQMDEEGRLVRGQRADKQLFRTAFEVDERQRDKQFRMVRDILNDDRALATRQQERAKDFLEFTDYVGYASQTADAAMKTAIGFQMQDEQNQFDLIKMFYGAAFSDQTGTPQFRSTAGSDAMTAAGIDAAVKGLANIASKNSSGYQQTNTPSYNQYGQATYQGTPVRDLV